MIIKIYAVLDKATGAFMQPFFSQSNGAAIRSLTDAVNDYSHPFAKHSSDYSLYFLGEFDDTTGMFATNDPVRLASAHELILSEVVSPGVFKKSSPANP